MRPEISEIVNSRLTEIADLWDENAKKTCETDLFQGTAFGDKKSVRNDALFSCDLCVMKVFASRPCKRWYLLIPSPSFQGVYSREAFPRYSRG